MEDTAPTQAARFLAAFRARWRRTLGVSAAAVAVAGGLSLLLPNWYRAESTVLPPTDSGETGFGLLTGMIQGSALANLGLATTNTPSDVFAEILKSRRLNEAAIRQFDLERVYRQRGMDRNLREFRQHLSVNVNAAGVLTVTFEDRDAQRASDVTNFLVNELDRFNVETYKTRGKRLRQFLEARLVDVHGQLAGSERRQQEYESKHRVLSASESEAVRGVSEILAQKFNLETQRAYISTYATPGSPERAGIEQQLAALNSEIGKLPEIKMEGARLALEVEVQRKLLSLLTAQFENARMQETRDTPTVTVLDIAPVPQLKSRPSRALIVVGAALAAILGSAAWTAATLARSS